MVSFSSSQYADFTALIASIDENAFVTLHRAHEINGEGWTWGLHSLGAADDDGDRAESSSVTAVGSTAETAPSEIAPETSSEAQTDA